MSVGSDRGVNGIAQAFTRWATHNENLEARQALAGLRHLGNFLIAVSNADVDLESGYKVSHADIPSNPQPQIELPPKSDHPSSILGEYFSYQELELLKKLRFLKTQGTFLLLPLLMQILRS